MSKAIIWVLLEDKGRGGSLLAGSIYVPILLIHLKGSYRSFYRLRKILIFTCSPMI